MLDPVTALTTLFQLDNAPARCNQDKFISDFFTLLHTLYYHVLHITKCDTHVIITFLHVKDFLEETTFSSGDILKPLEAHSPPAPLQLYVFTQTGVQPNLDLI